MKAENNSHFAGKNLLASSLRNESGIAMIAALLFLVMVVSLSPMAIRLTMGEIDRVNDFKGNRQAFFVAEAGLEHAKFLVGQTSTEAALFGPDDVVSATPGDPQNDDNGTFGAGTVVSRPDGYVYDEVAFNGNTYYIRAYDNDDGDGDPTADADNLIMLSAVGVVDGNTTTVEAIIYTPTGPTTAITTNGNLEMSGHPDVLGTCGDVHANGDLDSTSGVDIGGTGSASGTYEHGDSTVSSGAPNIDVPLLDPTEFQQYADYTLTASGTVLDANGDFVSNAPWNGWSYASPKWSLSDSLPADVSLYVEGDVEISNNPTGPWAVTIVATGYIDVSGGIGEFINKKNPADPREIQNIFMLAGTDLKFKGNNTHTIEGLFYAKDQVNMSGGTLIEGAIMAYNGSALESLVTVNKVRDNVTITYGCGLAVPGIIPSQVNVVSWNEIN